MRHVHDHHLDDVRDLQQLAYRCATTVGDALVPGDTEHDAARAMRDWLQREGVDDFFHLPFAWFGDRTALRWRNPLRFFPSNRVLQDGDPFILDVAPIRGRWLADIGYSGRVGTNDVHEQLLDDLAAHRSLILDGVRSGATLRAVYAAVDALAARQGYECRHRAYPGAVIAHRVDPVASWQPRFVLGFGLKGLARLGRTALEAVPAGDRHHPFWNGTRLSDHAPPPGLWAVEPHLAHDGVGAKFEEILVVDEDGGAAWLDDDLPHVRRWADTSAVTGVSA